MLVRSAIGTNCKTRRTEPPRRAQDPGIPETRVYPDPGYTRVPGNLEKQLNKHSPDPEMVYFWGLAGPGGRNAKTISWHGGADEPKAYTNLQGSGLRLFGDPRATEEKKE